ncbi:MAG TPA: FAD binding domain-containing protein [Anaerolineaceae bacterium]|nr:FAD binding domain-containing protein [Anaerolineaceae bacterium]
MVKYDYSIAQTIDDAVQLLNDPEIRSIPLAGGTDIFVAIRVNPLWFDRLVDIRRIPELTQIKIDGKQVSVGAAVTFSHAIDDPILKETAPFLVEACKSIGGPAIRNSGTFGGNVTNAAACADSIPSLVCLEATAHLISPNGKREVKVEDLVIGPHKTQMEPGELLTHFTFMAPEENTLTCFIKIGRRKAQSISRLSIAVMGKLNSDGTIKYVRLCPGAAVANPVRFRNVEAALIGKKPDKDLFSQSADKLVAEMVESTGKRWSTEYKEITLKAITERSLAKIFLKEETYVN